MRIRPDKVHDLARQIVAMMVDHPDVHLESPPDAVRVAVGSVILDDLKEEEDIDREVDALMTQHARQMEQADMDAYDMRLKFKQQIAKQRGFIL
jgi:hypothetical protein